MHDHLTRPFFTFHSSSTLDTSGGTLQWKHFCKFTVNSTLQHRFLQSMCFLYKAGINGSQFFSKGASLFQHSFCRIPEGWVVCVLQKICFNCTWLVTAGRWSPPGRFGSAWWGLSLKFRGLNNFSSVPSEGTLCHGRQIVVHTTFHL